MSNKKIDDPSFSGIKYIDKFEARTTLREVEQGILTILHIEACWSWFFTIVSGGTVILERERMEVAETLL